MTLVSRSRSLWLCPTPCCLLKILTVVCPQPGKMGGKSKRKSKDNSGTKGKNPKAFAPSNPFSYMQQQRRTLDVVQRKLQVPVVNRAEEVDVPPPIVIVVQGPPGVIYSAASKKKRNFTDSFIKRLESQLLYVQWSSTTQNKTWMKSRARLLLLQVTNITERQHIV